MQTHIQAAGGELYGRFSLPTEAKSLLAASCFIGCLHIYITQNGNNFHLLGI